MFSKIRNFGKAIFFYHWQIFCYLFLKKRKVNSQGLNLRSKSDVNTKLCYIKAKKKNLLFD